jgi:hypothetical protein
LDFTGFRPHERFWPLLEHGEAEICKTYAGLDEDLYITAKAEAFVKWHAGHLSWPEATRDARIQLHGPLWLIRASRDGTAEECSPTSGPTPPLPPRVDASPCVGGSGVATPAQIQLRRLNKV